MSNKKMLSKIDSFAKVYHITEDINDFDQTKLNKLISQDWFQRLFARFEATGNDAHQITEAYKKYIQTHEGLANTKEGKTIENLYYKYGIKSCNINRELGFVISNILRDLKEGNL